MSNNTTKEQAQGAELKNIKTTGFSTKESDSVRDYKHVSFNKSAIFTFSAFALGQLLKGAFPQLRNQSNIIDADILLLQKLTIYGVEWTDNQSIGLTRDEVRTLREWLESRMAHCEKERDSEIEEQSLWSKQHTARANHYGEQGFNGHESLAKADVDFPRPVQNFDQDTYITMKLLLIDIREWLLGEILD